MRLLGGRGVGAKVDFLYLQFCCQVQYYPRIDSVSPTVGSLAGGTHVTIVGGGFPMNESKAEVFVGGRKCIVTYSNFESIVCNTTAASNATVASKVDIETYSVDATTVDSEWLQLAEAVSQPLCPSHFSFCTLILHTSTTHCASILYA